MHPLSDKSAGKTVLTGMCEAGEDPEYFSTHEIADCTINGRPYCTLYVSDLASRCVWRVSADAQDLTAGGKNCSSLVSGLPGYPGALAMDPDGTLYIGYRWARSSWLEKNAGSTLLRGIALRAGRNLQEKLFSLPADAPCAEAVDTADGSWQRVVSGRGAGSVTALCPVESCRCS